MAVRITDLGEALHGGEVIVQTHVFKIEHPALEKLIKPFLEKKAPDYTTYSISVVHEEKRDENEKKQSSELKRRKN
ncbi:MAG: hypothetical protein JRI45_06740 [Deltaproteobacteria bacterium]|nr:hypothetical protein [Deltaproteobacteria bacterium]